MTLRLLSVWLVVMLLAGCGGGAQEGDADTAQQTADTAQQAADTMAAAHAGDTPEATAAAREPMIPVRASTVSYATTDAGEAVTGYIAAPENPDSVLTARGLNPETTQLPGLVVIHEWWGLNDNIRTAARRLAGEGYRVLAVDLYAGSTAETPEAARDLMQQALRDTDRLLANVDAARDFLATETGAPTVAVMGWCFGGGMTWNAAVAEPTAFDAAVVYYGSVESLTREALAAVDFPILALYGETDAAISVDRVREVEQMLAALDTEATFHYYDAGHAFANPSGQNYRPDAADDAWDKTTAFLDAHLYEPLANASDASM